MPGETEAAAAAKVCLELCEKPRVKYSSKTPPQLPLRGAGGSPALPNPPAVLGCSSDAGSLCRGRAGPRVGLLPPARQRLGGGAQRTRLCCKVSRSVPQIPARGDGGGRGPRSSRIRLFQRRFPPCRKHTSQGGARNSAAPGCSGAGGAAGFGSGTEAAAAGAAAAGTFQPVPAGAETEPLQGRPSLGGLRLGRRQPPGTCWRSGRGQEEQRDLPGGHGWDRIPPGRRKPRGGRARPEPGAAEPG